MTAVSQASPNLELKGIATSTEKMKTLEFGSYCLLDSAAFLNCSLDTLSNNLKNAQHTFPLLKQIDHFKDLSDDLIFTKSVFPYEWNSSIEKLQAATVFPPRQVFFSRLTNQDLSHEDYVRGVETFAALKCDNMCQYMEFYCLLDTVLLAEIVFQFRQDIYQQFQLDCSNYVSLPQLAFDSMLRMKKDTVDMACDLEMILLVENSLRGG